MAAQNFNFAPKFPCKMGISSPKCCIFMEENVPIREYSDKLQFSGGGVVHGKFSLRYNTISLFIERHLRGMSVG